MGCTSSSSSTKKSSGNSLTSKPSSFGRVAGLDRRDFMFRGQHHEILVKQAGAVNGQQFVLEDNKHCDVYLLDHMAALTIDMCMDCRIVLGPVASSVFVRDCSDCVIFAACQQLRLRNCHNISALLLF